MNEFCVCTNAKKNENQNKIQIQRYFNIGILKSVIHTGRMYTNADIPTQTKIKQKFRCEENALT